MKKILEIWKRQRFNSDKDGNPIAVPIPADMMRTIGESNWHRWNITIY